MKYEIERKFLVTGSGYKDNATSEVYRQGYLSAEKLSTVRVRIAGERALLTVKGATVGVTRSEFEYEIPLDEAQYMLENLCAQPLIEKVRYETQYAGATWVVDEFSGANQGLIVAEIELKSEDEHFDLPPWIGEEVSDDSRYLNPQLQKNPFSQWEDS